MNENWMNVTVNGIEWTESSRRKELPLRRMPKADARPGGEKAILHGLRAEKGDAAAPGSGEAAAGAISMTALILTASIVVFGLFLYWPKIQRWVQMRRQR